MIEITCKIKLSDNDLNTIIKNLSPYSLFELLKAIEKELYGRGWAIQGYYYHQDDKISSGGCHVDTREGYPQ